jgi:hypothetical protein
MLNGVYPSKDHIRQVVYDLSREHLTDFVVWNMIIHGHPIFLIDQNDSHWRVDVGKSLQYIFDTLNQTTQEGYMNLFRECRKRRVRKYR